MSRWFLLSTTIAPEVPGTRTIGTITVDVLLFAQSEIYRDMLNSVRSRHFVAKLTGTNRPPTLPSASAREKSAVHCSRDSQNEAVILYELLAPWAFYGPPAVQIESHTSRPLGTGRIESHDR